MLPVIAFTRQDLVLNRTFQKRLLQKMGLFDTIDSREEVVYDEYHEKYGAEMMERALFILANLDAYGK